MLYARHVEGFGTQVFAEVFGKDLEGMVGKRKLSLYKDCGIGWIKLKKSEVFASRRAARVYDEGEVAMLHRNYIVLDGILHQIGVGP
jgi:ATP-dependent DNA ligase